MQPLARALLLLAPRPGRLRCAGTVRPPSPRRLLGSERFFEPANDWRLNSRGRRPNELAHFLELGHHGLALYSELLSELVYPNLRHCAPSTWPGLPDPRTNRGSACSGRSQLVLFIAACSSRTHCNLSLLSSRRFLSSAPC